MSNSNLPHNATWNLNLIMPDSSDAGIAADRELVAKRTKDFAERWSSRSDYLTDPVVLKTALDEYELWQRQGEVNGASGAYIWLRNNQDQLDPKIKALWQQANDFGNEMQGQIRFFEMRIAKIEPQLQAQLLADPKLTDYRHFLERLFAEASHLLSEAEEKILALKSGSSRSKWVALTQGVIGRQEREITLPDGSTKSYTYEDLLSLTSNTDKTTRDIAAAAFNDILSSAVEAGEAEMNALLADHKINDELRGFTRPDASRLLGDDIDPEVVDVMLDSVSSRNKIAHRFYQLKAALMGVDKLEYHERNIEFGAINKIYDFQTGAKIVDEVYSELEPKFGEIFRSFQENGQIDIYPRKGKRGGAFCVYFAKSQPTYLLLNYTDAFRDVTTLAHEFGHGLNDEYMKAAQNQLNFGTPMATAEVASQYLEDFVLDRLQSDADEELEFAIMLSRLNDAVSSIFRQVACYRFEQSLHTQFRRLGFLSSDQIGELFLEAMGNYMGPAVVQSPGSANWWVYWGHIRNYFYVYSYASGLLIAKAMQRETRRDKAFLDKVKDFLSAGLSQSPKDIFAAMDIDITDRAFWEAGLDEVEQLLEATIKRAQELGKIKSDLVL